MTDVVAQPYVGFRTWSVENGRLEPRSAVRFRDAWDDMPARARCGDHVGMCDAALRDGSCMCGLYAYRYRVWASGPVVAGAIVAWGTIVQHETGFRAEYARPVAFAEASHYEGCTAEAQLRLYGLAIRCSCLDNSRLVREMADRYEVPVLPPESLSAYAGWFGTLPGMPELHPFD